MRQGRACVLGLLLTGTFVLACQQEPEPGEARLTEAVSAGSEGAEAPPAPRHHGPPKEAFAACEGKAVDAVCTVEMGPDSIEGSCRRGPGEDSVLVCVPKDFPPPSRHHGPPKEAFAACEGKAVDAVCTVAMGPDGIEGICRKGPGEDSVLVCVPKDFPPPPRHHGPPKEAFAACEGKAVDAVCTVAIGPDSIEGICRKNPGEDSVLACVPKDFPAPPRHHGPPMEAFAACEGKPVDAVCTVAIGPDSIEGICRKGPGEDSAPVCVPKDFPPPRHHGPPKEAFAACEGKPVDAACTVVMGPDSIEGICRKGPGEDSAPVCVPKDFPPPRHHGPPREAFAACEGKPVDASCTVAMGPHSLDGTCRQGPEGEVALACAPHKPPRGPRKR